MSRRILVTGASGFIGKHVLPGLAFKDYDVHAVARTKQTGAEVCGATWHACDLMDAKAVEALVAQVMPTHLLHLAWDVTPGKYWKAPENLDWVAASLRLFREFARCGGTRAVFAGTCAEYDWAHSTLTESVTPLAPRTPYGLAKHALHSLIETFSPGLKVSSAWGRIFFLYGPHEAHGRLVPQVIGSLLRNEEARCTQGLHQRDFLYVQDVADAFVSLVDSSLEGAVNISSGHPVAVRSIVEEIAKNISGTGKVSFGAIPLAADEPAVLSGDASRLGSIGFKPRYSLEQGIAETIAWWKTRSGPQ